MKKTPRTLLVSLLVVVVLSVGIGSSVFAVQRHMLPSKIAKQIQASVNNLIDEIKPGSTIHLQHKVYNRHGSGHAEIMELDWAVPEETIGDIWLGPVDNDGFAIGFKSILKDVDGNIVQETNAIGDVKIHRDISTGKELKSQWAPMSATEFMSFTGDIASKLVDDGWSFSSRGQWNGNETIILTKTIAWTPRPNDGSEFIDIPYTMDLNPAVILLRVEIRLDNPLLQIIQRWIIDNQGAKTLIWQDSWTLVEILS